MKTKLITLAVILTIIPNVAQARTYKVPHIKVSGYARISRSIPYSYTMHRLSRVRCPYAGCRSQIQP